MKVANYKIAVIISILVVFSCLGLARFAFGMILPSMKADLLLNATQVGWVGSLNFVGYFIGLFVANKFYTKFGAYTLIQRSLITQSISMLAMALLDNYLLISFAYFFTGFFGALANIAIMSYIAQIIPKQIRGKATGLTLVGAGSGIIFSGFLVPLYDRLFELTVWRLSWASFAIIIFLVALFIKQGFIFKPHEVNFSHNKQMKSLKEILLDKSFLQVATLYFIFGTTYVVLVTFFVLAAQVKWGVSSEISGSFWALFGFASLFAGPIFGSIADKIGNFKALAIIYFILTVANLILALDTPVYLLWVSAFLFGISTWGVPPIMTVLSSELFGSKYTAKILSLITIFFAVGQIVGPMGAGILVDTLGDFSYPFALSCTLTIFASISSYYFAKHSISKN